MTRSPDGSAADVRAVFAFAPHTSRARRKAVAALDDLLSLAARAEAAEAALADARLVCDMLKATEDKWLADMRRALERAAHLIEHLVQQVPEFTGVIGPAGEREDDYIRDGIVAEAAGFRALAASEGTAPKRDDLPTIEEVREIFRRAREREGTAPSEGEA